MGMFSQFFPSFPNQRVSYLFPGTVLFPMNWACFLSKEECQINIAREAKKERNLSESALLLLLGGTGRT